MNNQFDMQDFDSELPVKIVMNKVKLFNLHWHNYIEIFYVKRGNIRITTGDLSFHLDTGHICFIDSGIIHSVSQTDVDNEILVLQISTDSSSPFCALQKYKFNAQTYLSDLSNATLPLKELQRLLDDCYEESMVKATGYQTIISSFINALFGIMIRNFYLVLKTDDDYIAESNLQRLSNIISYLDSHYTERITLQELADNLHMNYYYLSHFFKDTAGVSFQDYLNNLRVDKSLSLLSNNDLGVTRIAYDIGFSNSKAYTKAFREKFGVIPSEYRKNMIPSNNGLKMDNSGDFMTNHLNQRESTYSSSNTIRNFLTVTDELSLHREAKHTIIEDIDLFSHTTESVLFTTCNTLFTDAEALLSLSDNNFRRIITALKIDHLKICLNNQQTESITQIIDHRFSDITYSIEANDSSMQCFGEQADAKKVLTLLSGSEIIRDVLTGNNTSVAPHLYDLRSDNLPEAFGGSNSLTTSFSVPLPLFFAYEFIRKLNGDIIYQSPACIVLKRENSYQILCYHQKSLDTYVSLNGSDSFSLQDYLFFADSYPSMKFSFSFKNEWHQLKQTTYKVAKDNGCILNNWRKLGSPSVLSSEAKEYLQEITRPDINIKIPPFRETPIITVDVPPFGFAYILLEILQ
jgi:xylan 1,4-beta-xylosidase